MALTMSSEAEQRNPNTKPLHFLLVPLMAQGHMIPMLDLARILAARGTLVTFATTPVNMARIQPIVDRAVSSALPIRFVELYFPVAQAGLPEGCENVDLLPSINYFLPFMNALHLLRDPLEAHLRDPDPARWPKPACIISDNIHHWTAEVARALDIPRLIFHGPSCFYLFCSHLIDRRRAELEAAFASESCGRITLPGLPQPIQVYRHEVISAWRSDPGLIKLLEVIREEEESADGVLVNSFAELEPWYLERYSEARGKPVWPVGPVSLYKEELDAKAARGRVSSVDNKLLLEWLDGKEAGSVVLVSFGSIVRNTMPQIAELGHGLEASGRPFIWVVKEAGEGRVPGVEEWVAEFEKRVEGRGMIIRGWAPQMLMLGHVAVGGFLTHCGWNSILEAVAAGVVMATWPHFADQFLNARLVVDVLRIGVAIGVEEPMMIFEEREDVVRVKRGEVESVVEKLMGGREEDEERRERARELGKKATKSMEKGGSSWKGLQDVISYVAESGKKRDEKINHVVERDLLGK